MRLDNIMWGNLTDLMLCRASTLLIRLNIVPTKGRKALSWARCPVEVSAEGVEGSMNLPVVVAILFDDVLQEHQLGLQAVFITESSGSVYQSG
jgi:hypothetical protein